MALRHAIAALLATAIIVEGFVLPRTAHHNVHKVLRATKDNNPERQRTLDEAKRILARAANTPVEADQGLGGAVTGALVGSFLLGPLGMLMGAAGSNVGQAASAKKQMEQRLASLGVDDEVIRNVGEASRDLAEADESRGYVQSALESASAFAATLKRDRDAAQQAAERAVKDGDDDSARKYLTARIALDKRCAVAEAEAVDATQRLKRAEADVGALRVRCDDLDYLVARAVVAKSRGEAVSPFPGGAEDSLLARFRALEEE
ncbi:unnamed protein product [Pelagomonas calceolata]|uniref:Glycine zipper domain-containing protein n=1 Tax=Pelagomonas calceolata TaxID=35677 RepID=A0A8J2WPW0_9STRA|nr:unnamed protein product [Pelagomonas calceolata]